MKNKLEKLREHTVVVADTGDIRSIKQYAPTDATTNPSLIFKAATEQTEYADLVEDAIAYGRKKQENLEVQKKHIIDKLFVNFGLEVLKIVPGRVSTEVDASLSFDVNGSLAKARHLISLYEAAGIGRERILIKLASTWEGIKTAEILEKEGIHCNMTLLFSMPQAVACAEVRATLISPFVGRIMDWYKKNERPEGYAPDQDPGVRSVKDIYNYYKKFGYKTQIMGASFRNSGEILELAGCDLLTISPTFLKELQSTEGDVPRKLDPETAKKQDLRQLHPEEKDFRYLLNENAMATEKLAEGIRHFVADLEKLKNFIDEKMSKK